MIAASTDADPFNQAAAKAGGVQNTPPRNRPDGYDSQPQQQEAPSSMQPTMYADAPDQLEPCPSCGRKFKSDRLDKHLGVCNKVFVQKRKQFDAKGMRNQDLE